MKLTCKQCGKEFELSESEINFYKSKNLHIPKRCKQCRQANKKNKVAEAKPYENTHMQDRNYMPSGNSGCNSGRNNKLLSAILIIAIVLLAGGIVLSHVDLFGGYSESTNPIYGEVAYTSEDIHNQPETAPETFNSQPKAESDTAISKYEAETGADTVSSKSETDADALNNESDTEKSEADAAQSIEPAGDVTGTGTDKAQDKQTAESNAPKNNPAAESETSEADVQAAQSSSVSTPQYKFRNSELLNDHFEKHGKEMGFTTAKDYQAAASAVVTSAEALHKLEAEDGDDVYYIESSNDFVIVSTDGYIRTYFRPNSGIEYYNRQ